MSVDLLERNVAALGQNLPADIDPSILAPIDGDPSGKDFLSVFQCNREDLEMYLAEATAAGEAAIWQEDLTPRLVPVLPGLRVAAAMRQPSTRTAETTAAAAEALGGSAHLITGMKASAEAKGESRPDSDLALAIPAHILATRTAEEWGPARAAQVIHEARERGKLTRKIPVINLGDGRNEHPTQAIGDLLTIRRELAKPERDIHHFEDMTAVVVGDHERYRAFHSLIGAFVMLGGNVVAVESPVAPVPEYLVEFAGDQLTRTTDLDGALEKAQILYVGRNPDEYKGMSRRERRRSRALAKAYESWVIDQARVDLMPENGIVMHPRPRRNEVNPEIDADRRTVDVQQMENLIPARMAIIASALGRPISQYVAPAA